MDSPFLRARDSDSDNQAPKLKIDNGIYDFGNIKQGEKVTKEFKITNTGKSDLNIRMTRATCGCTA